MTTTAARRTGTVDPAAVTEMISAAYRDHAASIHGIALRSTRDPEVAADITQEAFLRLVTEAQTGRFPDNVGGWLYRTSANLVISRGRRLSVARRFAPRLVRYDGPAEPDAVALLQEESRELDLALATLSTIERVALLMAAAVRPARKSPPDWPQPRRYPDAVLPGPDPPPDRHRDQARGSRRLGRPGAGPTAVGDDRGRNPGHDGPRRAQSSSPRSWASARSSGSRASTAG